jgi:hypothetical protein
MGHIAAKDIYRKLGKRLDQAPVRTPWTPVFRQLVEELYSRPEAELVARLPYRPSTLGRIAAMLKRARGYNKTHDRRTVCQGSGHRHLGWRTVPVHGQPHRHRLFRIHHDAHRAGSAPGPLGRAFPGLHVRGKGFPARQFRGRSATSVMRALPHEEALGEHVEILDYEKASALIEEHTEFSLGLCSCRHEKHHLGHAPCPTPMDTCTSMGTGRAFSSATASPNPSTRCRCATSWPAPAARA